MNRYIVSLILISILLPSCTNVIQTVFGNNNETMINPLPGQYTDYSIKFYENGEMSYSGWLNISYNDYLEPNLINTTIWLDVPDNRGLFWCTINTTNRWIPYSNFWESEWYPMWIETNVTVGSEIRIISTTGTVVGSEVQMISSKLVDCWVLNFTMYNEVFYSFFFDKETGVCVAVHMSDIHSMVIQLVATNIPIGMSPPHDLAVYLNAPANIEPNRTTTFKVTVINSGLNVETNVEAQLFIDGYMVNSTVVPSLESQGSFKLTYTWTSMVYGTYNVTAYVHSVPEEFSEVNNRMTRFVKVSSPPGVGVKIGDWIKYSYMIPDMPPGTPYPEWMKVEVLDIEGSIATINVTMHMSNGTEASEIMQLDVLGGYGSSVTFSGLVIPANRTKGDPIYLTGVGNLNIMGESLGNYAGANRTTVFIRLSMQGIDFVYHWDKQTGILVESIAISGGLNVTCIATETTMWESSETVPFDLNMDGIVNIMDIVEAANAFGSYPGHERWDPMADVNRDNEVNILDVIQIVMNFGTEQ